MKEMTRRPGSRASADFENIIGYEEIVAELSRIADALRGGAACSSLGARPPRGLILHGIPGVGKTLMATELMRASRRKCFTVRKEQSGSDLHSRIHQVFSEAAGAGPSVILLDDMDKYSEFDDRFCSDEFAIVQSCMDECSGEDIFVIATTNELKSIPDSLQRPGRFGKIIRIMPPCLCDATRILDKFISTRPCDKDVDAGDVARILSGRSCAHIVSLMNEAALIAAYERSPLIRRSHVIRAALSVLFGISNYEPAPYAVQRQIAYHEAGHVMAMERFNRATTALVSIRTSDSCRKGVTVFCPEAQQSTAGDTRKAIITTLAGLAAVDIKFGTSDNGAGSDIEKAFELARCSVTDMGFSGLELTSRRYDDSFILRRRQENAENFLIDSCYRDIRKYLIDNIALLDRLADELLARHTLLTDEICRILYAV